MLKATIMEATKRLNLLLSDKWRDCASATKPLLQLTLLRSLSLQFQTKHPAAGGILKAPLRSDRHGAAAQKHA